MERKPQSPGEKHSSHMPQERPKEIAKRQKKKKKKRKELENIRMSKEKLENSFVERQAELKALKSRMNNAEK